MLSGFSAPIRGGIRINPLLFALEGNLRRNPTPHEIQQQLEEVSALPRAESVKLTITVAIELKAQLDAYAEVHTCGTHVDLDHAA